MQPPSHIGLNPNRTHSTTATQDEGSDKPSQTSTKTTNQSRRIFGQSPVERQDKREIRYQRQKARDKKLQRKDLFESLNLNNASTTARLQKEFEDDLEGICEYYDSYCDDYEKLIGEIFIPLKKLLEVLGHLNCYSSPSNDLFRLFIVNNISLSGLININKSKELQYIQRRFQQLEEEFIQLKNDWWQCQGEHPGAIKLDLSDINEMLSIKQSSDTFFEELLKSITPRLETLQSTGYADSPDQPSFFYDSLIPEYQKYAENILLCFHTQLEELTRFYNQHAKQKITDQNRQIWEKNYRELRRMKELLGLELAPDILPDAEFQSVIDKRLVFLSTHSFDTESESASTASAHSSDSDSESNSTHPSSTGEYYDDDYSSTSEQNQTLLEEIETLYQQFEEKLASNNDEDSADSLGDDNDSVDSLGDDILNSLDDDISVSSRHKTNKKGKSSDHRTARFLQKQKPLSQASKPNNADKTKEKEPSDHKQYYVRNNRLVPAPSTSKSPPQRTARVVEGKTVDRQTAQGDIPVYVQSNSTLMHT